MKINTALVEKILTSFIHDELSLFQYKKGIFGLSGGLDSSVTAFLTTRALGNKNVLGLIMPYSDTFHQDIEHARQIVDALDIQTKTIDISPMVDMYFKEHPTDNKILKGNKMARERMSILYDYSAREKALIIGTSNKTELLLGYGTIHGDMACAINPIGDLYKTQVREMARHLGVPEEIILKTPTAGLWPGQTDEGELGMSYDVIDQILFHLVDKRRSKEEIIALGFDKETIEPLIGLIKNSEFKRKLPPIAKISDRTIGLDFLYPFDREK